MTRATCQAAIRETLTRLTETDASTVPLDADLGAAIGLDSLGHLELLSEMEDRFDVTIFEADSDAAATIGGMIDILETALADKKETA